MDKNIKKFSIILPTLNEAENLKTLIPEIFKELKNFSNLNFEVLVVDDNSNDGTYNLIQSLQKKYKNLNIYVRSKEKSLPLSILDGVKKSKHEYVMWLDADGSMSASTVKKMILNSDDNKSVVIASRFVEGGGYKGVKENQGSSFIKAILNVRGSKDSVLGMIFSIIFNKFLQIIFRSNVKDLTSGFIFIHKDLIYEDAFKISSYGEYFIFLVNDLLKKNVKIYEIGYICGTRKYGESKTANSFRQLVSRGIPYIKAVIKCRYLNYGNTK